MSQNIISLLPDSVANQIAAGEVVQRPSSAVKELLENSIDAGAHKIQLIVKDAGKSLIQVIDDGKGMSEVDTRMAFERHATSKIRTAEDIFRIRTMGFRGEALASIAAVAQVEIRTRQEGVDLGNELRIEGTRVTHTGFCQTPVGTNLSVRNLFFNIPARRNFLKSNQVELKHIIDEFERVALANPEVEMTLVHNQNELFHLLPGNLKQRIIGILGRKYSERIVPVEESTEVVSLKGFVMKPEFARKTRGEQFFFVNDRYIKNPYLHHAVTDAFEDLVAPDQHPGYILFLDIDPSRIDVNIHPTKTEIKFEDEKAIYAILRSSIKHALGQFNIRPTIDFESDTNSQAPPIRPGQAIRLPGIEVDPNYNPFSSESKSIPKGEPSQKSTWNIPSKPSPKGWESMFTSPERETSIPEPETGLFSHPDQDEEPPTPVQLDRTYILYPHEQGILVIHQNRAHQRVLFEAYLKSLRSQAAASQQLLFPVNLEFSANDYSLLESCMDDLRSLGFDIESFGQNSVILHGIPVHMNEPEIPSALEQIIEELKNSANDIGGSRMEAIAATLARASAIKVGTILDTQEMLHLVVQWNRCTEPGYSPGGKPVSYLLSLQEIAKRLN